MQFCLDCVLIESSILVKKTKSSIIVIISFIYFYIQENMQFNPRIVYGNFFGSPQEELLSKDETLNTIKTHIKLINKENNNDIKAALVTEMASNIIDSLNDLDETRLQSFAKQTAHEYSKSKESALTKYDVIKDLAETMLGVVTNEEDHPANECLKQLVSLIDRTRYLNTTTTPSSCFPTNDFFQFSIHIINPKNAIYIQLF